MTQTNLTNNQQKDQFKNRRKMAWLSFWFLSVGAMVLVVAGMTFTGVADRVQAMSFVLGTVFGVWASVILAYFGASTFTQTRETKNQTDEISIRNS